MTEVFFSYQTFAHLDGTRQRVLLTNVSPDGKHYVAHNKSYVQVLVPRPCVIGKKATFGDSYMLGKMVEVTVVATAKHHVVAEIAGLEDLLAAPKRPPPVGGMEAAGGDHEVIPQLRRRKVKRTSASGDSTLDNAKTPSNSDDESACCGNGSCSTGDCGACGAEDAGGCSACGGKPGTCKTAHAAAVGVQKPKDKLQKHGSGTFFLWLLILLAVVFFSNRYMYAI